MLNKTSFQSVMPWQINDISLGHLVLFNKYSWSHFYYSLSKIGFFSGTHCEIIDLEMQHIVSVLLNSKRSCLVSVAKPKPFWIDPCFYFLLLFSCSMQYIFSVNTQLRVLKDTLLNILNCSKAALSLLVQSIVKTVFIKPSCYRVSRQKRVLHTVC